MLELIWRNEVKYLIGQKVAVQSIWGLRKGYTVIKISPTGQVTVKREGEGAPRRFTAYGYEIGYNDRFDKPRLIAY